MHRGCLDLSQQEPSQKNRSWLRAGQLFGWGPTIWLAEAASAAPVHSHVKSLARSGCPNGLPIFCLGNDLVGLIGAHAAPWTHLIHHGHVEAKPWYNKYLATLNESFYRIIYFSSMALLCLSTIDWPYFNKLLHLFIVVLWKLVGDFPTWSRSLYVLLHVTTIGHKIHHPLPSIWFVPTCTSIIISYLTW